MVTVPHDTHHQHNSIYFDACDYAVVRLETNAPRYFPRLHELAKVNSLEELKAIVDSWADALPTAKPIPDGLWKEGSRWGDSVRVECDRGIFWKMRCACGRVFHRSTNDTVPESRRKCSTCVLADELSVANQAVIARLEDTSRRVLEWHRVHNKLLWSRVYKALCQRGIDYVDDNVARELNAMCWAKITAVADQYRDHGHKVGTWLVRVADNTLRDFFKVKTNRERLAPTRELDARSDGGANIADPRGPRPPAKPVRPRGADPQDHKAKPTAWDRKTTRALRGLKIA
jgi:hypothetical protein